MYRRRKSQQEQRKKNRIEKLEKDLFCKIKDFVVGKVFFLAEKTEKNYAKREKYKNSIKIV